MNVDDQIYLWDHAAIKVLDVRHQIMRMGETFQSYKMPSNGFIFVSRGRAQVQLNQTSNMLLKEFPNMLKK